MNEQAPSKELFEAWLNSPASYPAVSHDNPYTDWQTQHLYEAWCASWSARATLEPRADLCEAYAKPLPPVGAWSMPSCPDCQELLEGLGQLMGDFADREQTIKADWIGRAINLICARASQPPACNHSALSPKGTMFYHGFVGPANRWRCDVCKGEFEGNLTEPGTLGSQSLTLISSSQPPAPRS